jgi:hypothetical protein
VSGREREGGLWLLDVPHAVLMLKEHGQEAI